MNTNLTMSRELLLARLKIDLDEVTLWQLPHYIAVEYWLTDYKPETDAPNLEKVRGYLEAFHHLCEMEEWERASFILSIRLNTPTNEKLHEQLGTWGYYRQQIDLYNSLLDKLNPSWDSIFFNGLGKFYYVLGDYSKAIEYFQKSLIIVEEIGKITEGGVALSNLGNVYCSLGNYAKAIEYHQQSLAIAREIRDRQIEGYAMGNLGNTYKVLGEYNKAFEYHQQSLAILREIGDRKEEGVALSNLGNAYYSLGEFSIAIKYYQQSLAIAREIGNRWGEGNTLRNLGLAYDSLGNQHQAMKYLEQAIAIFTEIGVPQARQCQELKEKLLNQETE